MSISTEEAVYRLRRFYRKSDVPNKYTGTFEITDDNTHTVMAVCDLGGKAVFSTLEITDNQNKIWQMKPNRRIMPSHWVITDPEKNVAMQFDQKVQGKMTNPLYRIALALVDSAGKEVYRLVDPRTSVPDRVLGVGPNEWALMSGDKPVAKLVWLARQTKPAKGILGKMKEFLTTSERGIVSAGGSHALPAPVALGMLMLFEELTDTSGG